VSTFIPLSTGEDVQVRFGLPDHKEEFLAEAEICWLKTGHLGVRFVSLSPDRKSDLQEWLASETGRDAAGIGCTPISEGTRSLPRTPELPCPVENSGRSPASTLGLRVERALQKFPRTCASQKFISFHHYLPTR
jgi:hypothetical protein